MPTRHIFGTSSHFHPIEASISVMDHSLCRPSATMLSRPLFAVPADHVALVVSSRKVAVYMALSEHGELTRQLFAHGRAPIIENSSPPTQRKPSGVLNSFPTLTKRRAIDATAMLTLGEIAETSHWNSKLSSTPLRHSVTARALADAA
jgi:siroheme synthase